VLIADGIEHEVRRVVARHLGISKRLLEPEASLRDDFASDRQTIEQLVLAVETRLGVRLHERALDEVRSYGQLVSATVEAIRAQRAQVEHDSDEAATGRVRITGTQGLIVERAGTLTPYELEDIYADARRAGPGASLTIAVTATTTDDQIARLRRRFAAVERCGVAVHVTRRS
jgi:acyl carrier protein